MTYAMESYSFTPGDRPLIGSYDLGYEYSQQHYIALQCMVDDADAEEDATLAHVPPAIEEVVV